jgi:hypothetical protein
MLDRRIWRYLKFYNKKSRAKFIFNIRLPVHADSSGGKEMKNKITFATSVLLIAALLLGCAQQEITTMKSTRTSTTPVEEEAADEPVQEEKYEAPKTTTKTTTTTTSTAMSFEEEEAKAIAAAEDFVKSLDGYKNQRGRQIQTHNTAKLKCTGCWLVQMSYTRDLLYYPDKDEKIMINVELKDWKMTKYTFG